MAPVEATGVEPHGSSIHATCVVWQRRGILILGEPGQGKTTAALELLAHGAHLVADDLVHVTRVGRALVARPAGSTGLIEVRGVGIFAGVHARATQLYLCVTLEAATARERLPDQGSWELLGVSLPHLRLARHGAPLAPRLAFVLSARRVD